MERGGHGSTTVPATGSAGTTAVPPPVPGPQEGGQVVRPTADRPLPEQVGHLVDEVARLRGIRVEELPHAVRAQFDRIGR
jgi:hypothetical protein